MNDERKTLIQALELRVHTAKKNKQGFVDLTYTMTDRIIAMLNETEEPARLMTRAEVVDWINSDCNTRDPICEEVWPSWNINPKPYLCWIDPCDDYDTADIVGYGENVRVWTKRPTEKQRAEAKWANDMHWYGKYVALTEEPTQQIYDACVDKLKKSIDENKFEVAWETMEIIYKTPENSGLPFQVDPETGEEEVCGPFWTIAIKVKAKEKNHE